MKIWKSVLSWETASRLYIIWILLLCTRFAHSNTIAQSGMMSISGGHLCVIVKTFEGICAFSWHGYSEISDENVNWTSAVVTSLVIYANNWYKRNNFSKALTDFLYACYMYVTHSMIRDNLEFYGITSFTKLW